MPSTASDPLRPLLGKRIFITSHTNFQHVSDAGVLLAYDSTWLHVRRVAEHLYYGRQKVVKVAAGPKGAARASATIPPRTKDSVSVHRLIDELVGIKIEIWTTGGQNDFHDQGVLEAADGDWLRLTKTDGSLLYFPIHQIRLLKPLGDPRIPVESGALPIPSDEPPRR
ncbi:MAG TPA: hypothetical protein VGN26_01785 [Armatimonadota bacterium]